MTTQTTITETIHPWELAGHGKAPFRIIGVSHEVGPRDLGNGLSVGAPGQPMGTCAICGAGIADVFGVQSADGKTFTTGSTCIEKLAGGSKKISRDPLVREARRRMNAIRNDRRHKREAAKIAEAVAALPSVRDALADLPSPHKGDGSLLSFVDWMLDHAGNAGKLRVAKIIMQHANN